MSNPRWRLTLSRSGLAALLAIPIPDGAPSIARAEKPWTILIYGAADNNCDGHMFGFLNGIRSAVADDPGLDVVLFMDRSTGYSNDSTTLGEDFTGARLYLLHEKSAERLAGGDEFPEMALDHEYEADSADPTMVKKFIDFGKARFPARRYALLIYSHANGVTMCPDEQSGHDMGIAELTDVVGEEESVDFMGLELCTMGGIEIAYQWRPGNGGFSTEVLAAIPNAGPALDWNRIFARIHTPGQPAARARDDCLDPVKMTAQDFGKLVVEEGGKGRLAIAAEHPEAAEHLAHESVAAYDLRKAAEVKKRVDAFAVALARTNAKAAFEEIRGPGAHGCVMNYVNDRLASEHPFVDLYDLLRRSAASEELAKEARDAARAAMEATHELVIASFGMSGYANFEPGRNGIFIVCPAGDAKSLAAGGSRVWRLLDWYVPFEEHGHGAPHGGNWAWCRDGAIHGNGVVENWFELLDSWYDVDNGEAGGLNGYRW